MTSRASTTSAVLTTLDAKINSVAADTAAAKAAQQEYERKLQANLKDVYDKQKEKSLGGGMAGRRAAFQLGDRENNMSMDVDDVDVKGKNRKYVIRVLSLANDDIDGRVRSGHHRTWHLKQPESGISSKYCKLRPIALYQQSPVYILVPSSFSIASSR